MRIKFIYVIAILSAFMCLSGCNRDVMPEQGSERTLSVSLLTAPISETSDVSKSVTGTVDEGTSSDYQVADFWLFEYGPDGSLLGTPRYYTGEDYDFSAPVPVSVILPSSPEVSYKVIIVANTHDDSFLSGISYNTLNALKMSVIYVNSSEDLYSGEDLLMNGVVDITSSSSSVDCMMYRNVAKLALNLKNSPSSGIVINSVQLKNVPDRLFVADHFYAQETVFPDASLVDFVQLEKDVLDLQEGSEIQLLYYLPRNMQGMNNSTTEAGKNVNAPANATYVEVLATRKESHAPVRYRFYLGANDINDFNVKSNHLYEFVVDFSKFGDVNDNRVEDMSVVNLEDSNSYMVNPSDGSNIRYVVPIENRINTFWKSESGQLNAEWKDYLIGYGQEWVAEVIWQDVNKQVIKFCNDDGTLTDTYRGLADDRYFTFVTTDAAIGTPCNVVIGVRRASDSWSALTDGYMWSWHLWLTDYDPDEDTGGWQDGIYTYPVSGGSVQRYSSFEDISIYEGMNVFIMDRNFGAKGYTREHGWAKSTGTLYQYGRKDPFPTADRVYDITGAATRTISRMPGIVNLNATVLFPEKFITQEVKDVYDWSSEAKYRPYDWNDLHMAASKGESKSFFDPCPPGWRLPTYLIWSDFGNKNRANASNWFSTDTNDNEYYTADNGSDAGWLFYLDGKTMSGDVTYYPGSGMRNYTTGNYGGGGNGALWSAISSNAAGVYLYYDNSSEKYMLPSQSFFRYMGMPVRCITTRDAE